MRRTGSSDGRPQPGVAVTCEVPDVRRRDDDQIARLAERGRACRRDDIRVECVGGGSRQTALSGVCPERRGLAPCCRRHGKVGQPSRRDQLIPPAERPHRMGPGQFAPDFKISNLRDDDLNASRHQPVYPEPASISQGHSTSLARVTQRAGIEQHILLHRSVTSLEQGPMGTHLVDPAHPFLIRRIVRFIGEFSNFEQSLTGRFQAIASLFLALPFELPIRSQARRWQRLRLPVESFRQHDRGALRFLNLAPRRRTQP
jgi:hypothetical protein